MTRAKDGGPAFPSSYATPSGPVAYDDNYGMTLRDYFAAAALQGYIAAGVPSDSTYDDVAEKAFKAADSMLKERDNGAV